MLKDNPKIADLNNTGVSVLDISDIHAKLEENV